MDKSIDDARGMKRNPECEGGGKWTTRGRHYLGSAEESDKNAHMEIEVPHEESHEQELNEAWDVIDSQD